MSSHISPKLTLRWGIAGAGKISHDFVNAVMSILPATDHLVKAVAARDLTRAKAFADFHNIPKSYGSYEELAKDPEIDIVYIGVLNPDHLNVGELMLNNKKHVLCEKPLTMNLKETKRLIGLAKEKKLFLMEAVWSRAFPVYKELRKALDSGIIGEIKHVDVSFGFHLPVDRLTKKQLGGGTILDLGVYTLQLQQFVYCGFGKVEKPVKIVATGHLNEEGVDLTMSGTILYSNGRTAVVSTSALVQLPNEAVIVGTKGTIRVPEFWCPTTLILPNETLHFPLPKARLEFNFHNSAGLHYEAEEARQCIANGLTENVSISLDQSMQLAELMDALRKELGVVYPQD